MTLPAEPLVFQPIYKEKLWGGNALGRRFNRPLPEGRAIGESWEIVSHGPDQSVVGRGALTGKTLGRLVTDEGAALLGKIDTFGKFPLLNKFIDAQDRLSVQVHPNDHHARTYGWGEFGKTECWYVADAKKDAELIVGFKTDVTREAINQAIENSNLQNLLNYIPIQAGDVLLIPAGTVHSIMGGALIYEIQESSDATLRLYDWGRVDSRGNPRTLHVHDALKVIDTHGYGPYHIEPVILEENGRLHTYCVACRYFALEHYAFTREGEIILLARQSFRIVTVLNGRLRLKYPTGTTEAPPGTTLLLPAALHDVLAWGPSSTELLITWVPDLYSEIISPLRERRIPSESIEKIGGVEQYNDLIPLLY